MAATECLSCSAPFPHRVMADNATVHFRTAAELNDASLGNVVPPEYSRPLFVMGGPDTSLSNAISFHETEFVRGCAWNLCPRDDDVCCCAVVVKWLCSPARRMPLW